jgi:hypothetical protein
MSFLSGPAPRLEGGAPAFHRARPQVLRIVLQTLDRAVAAAVCRIGGERLLEPQFTRQLLLDFESARDAMPGSPRYDITHQPELPIADGEGRAASLRRLDLRILFRAQLGRTGDYLCVECKYLDTTDRNLDREYVNEGVDRIVIGDYARHHPWAVMVGLERTGPLHATASHVDARLVARYGANAGFKANSSIRLPFVRESDHDQAGGPHRITIVHSFHLIAAGAGAG